MRKNTIAFGALVGFFVCLSLVLLSSFAVAQEEQQLNHYFSMEVKSGMGSEFESFIKNELNPALRKGGVTELSVWKTAVFGKAGHYVITQQVKNLSQYDQPNPLLKALGEKGFAEMMAKIQKYVRNVDMSLVVMRPDLGIEVPPDYVPKLVIQVRIDVAPGRTADYEKGTKEVMGVVKKANAKGAYAAKVLLGGNPNEYHSVVLLDSFTDMDRFAEAFSKGMAEANLTPMTGVITRIEYRVYSYLPELGIQAPAQ